MLSSPISKKQIAKQFYCPLNRFVNMLSKFRILLLGIACGLSTYGKAQVVGGQFSFEFLRLSSAAHTTASVSYTHLRAHET